MKLCANHKHPRLARPISSQQFAEELANLCADAGITGRVEYEFTPELDREHELNERRYARVEPYKRVFEFTQAVLWLPEAHRLGLLAHEIGHCLAPEGSEDDADEAAERVFGKIAYDRRWGGKGLQCLLRHTLISL